MVSRSFHQHLLKYWLVRCLVLVTDNTLDSGVVIVAGSDTTSTTLAAVFKFLISHPDKYQRLQSEIDGVFPQGETPFVTEKYSKLPYLNAVMSVNALF